MVDLHLHYVTDFEINIGILNLAVELVIAKSRN